MFLTNLSVHNFRNYQKREMGFSTPTTVFLGPNAVGKTNILETIFLLATGESFRAEKIEEMVRWGDEVAHISGQWTPASRRGRADSEQLGQLQVTLTRGMVQGRKVQKRSFKVNGVGRRKSDFAGNVKAVIFRPEDIDLVAGSPHLRRGFLDTILMQVDREYRRSLVSYEKGLRRRNRLLTQIQAGEVPRTVLAFWDMLLIKEGTVLTGKRQELIEFINSQPQIEQSKQLLYDFSVISEKRLKQYEQEEVAAGYTLVGPHRDDFSIQSTSSAESTKSNTWRDLAIYGSRGEQRMAVVWLKLAELAFIEEKTGERPILLLDDIFSELDDRHDQLIMNLLGKQQTVLTTTELDHRFEKFSEIQVIKLT